LDRLVQVCARRLRPASVEVYVAPSDELNAYTFGLGDPKVIVLYRPLLRVMDADELTFIIGHEMGHVALGHTWLNSLVGGLAGIPASLGSAAILTLALRSWSRACEYSADRAGLLACGDLEKATTALVKLVAGPQALDPAALARAYRQIDAEDDTLMGLLNENLATHPLLIRRIQALRAWAAGPEYARWQARLTAESEM
jgi:Zn-dependent protease with chaperone function